jgi:hypothetical protein
VAHEGFGKHVHSLEDGNLLKILKNCEFQLLSSLSCLTLIVYIAENIYVMVLAITKLSILAFYLRIFQHQVLFRAAVWVTAVIVIFSTGIISVLTIFSCRPINFFWDKDIKEWSMSRCQCARICQQCHEHYTRSSDRCVANSSCSDFEFRSEEASRHCCHVRVGWWVACE